MLDFAFPPHAPLSVTVHAMQQAHIQYSLKFGAASASASASGSLSAPGAGFAPRMLGGGGGMLPEATPGLHYFPEFTEGRPRREQDLADLMLGVQVRGGFFRIC
jgi:hypothetical protein